MNLEFILKYEREHPYVVAFALAFIIFMIILFYTPPMEVTDQMNSLDDEIRILNVDTFRAPKRVVKKIISIDKGEPTVDDSVKKASGTSLENSAFDIDALENRIETVWKVLEKKDIDRKFLYSRSLISPATCCLVNPDGETTVEKAFKTVRDLSSRLREKHQLD